MKKSLSDIRMVFVVCMGRSGSTLLQSLLDSHTAVKAPIESKFFLHLRTKYKNTKQWNQKKFDAFVSDVFDNRKINTYWNIDKELLKAQFQQYEVTRFSDACKLVYLAYPSISPKDEIKLIIDKNPGYSLQIPKIKEVFPNAAFVHLIRDPRAVLQSQRSSLKKKRLYSLAFQWNYFNKTISKETQGKATLIRYEDLVNDPRPIMENLTMDLDIPFQESMLTNQGKINSRVKKGKAYWGLEHHLNVTKPVSVDFIEKWKTRLTSHQIHVINSICHKIGKHYNYSIDSEKLSLIERLKYFLGKRRFFLGRRIVKTLFGLPFFVRKILLRTTYYLYDNFLSKGKQ